MLWFFKSFFPVVWILFIVFWRIKAANTKTNQRVEPAASGILRALTFLIVIVLLSVPRIPLPWLYRQLWPGLWPFWIGAAVTVVGLLFAIWALQHLASNWSSAVIPFSIPNHQTLRSMFRGDVCQHSNDRSACTAASAAAPAQRPTWFASKARVAGGIRATLTGIAGKTPTGSEGFSAGDLHPLDGRKSTAGLPHTCSAIMRWQ